MANAIPNASARPIIGDWFLMFMLAGSLAGNVYLGYRLMLSGVSQSRTPPRIAEGTPIASFQAKDSQGLQRDVKLAGASRPTVMLLYSTSCQWCKKTWPLYRQIAKERTDRFRFVTIGLEEELTYTDPSVEPFASPSGSSISPLLVGSVPLTVVISKDGRIERSWIGAYTGRTGEEVRKYFDVVFPTTTSQ